MRFRKVSSALALAAILLAAPGCKDFFDVNTDPLSPTEANVVQLLPGTQVAMSTYLGFNIQGLGHGTSGYMSQVFNGRAEFIQAQNAWQTPWSGLYTDMLSNNEIIIRQATADASWGYVGVAQLQKAYVFSQLVDAFGDVPYSEALKGTQGVRNPRFDAAVDIYNGNADKGIQGLFSLIDEALANLAKPGATINGSADIVYGGNMSKWQHFGQALKLKLYNQIRKTRDVSADVQPLLTQGLLNADEDFSVGYGQSNSPENRHIGFLSDYVNTPPENSIAPYIFLLMTYGDGKDYAPTVAADPDPRIPYYFFNQLASPGSAGLNGFSSGRFFTTIPYSTDGSGSANTGDVRTLPGLYPYGGRYDNGTGIVTDESSAPGNGIQRLLPYFSQKFTEAEIQLTVLNNPTAAEVAYREGVTAAFAAVDKVASRVNGAAPGAGTNYINTPGIGAPPASILNKFANASSNEDKLRVLMEQKYIASFGMGPDIYTDFRRTHYPVLAVPGEVQAQPDLGLVADTQGGNPYGGTNASGFLPRRLYYPLTDLIANLSPEAPKVQVQPGDANYRIFWDR